MSLRLLAVLFTFTFFGCDVLTGTDGGLFGEGDGGEAFDDGLPDVENDESDLDPGGNVDAGVDPDDGVDPDVGVDPDGDVDPDPDAGGEGEEACAPIAADAPRVIVLGHPFGAEAGIDGTEISSLTLPPGGAPEEDGMRLDIGVKPKRIAATPSGRFAIVLSEDGTLTSVATPSADALAIADSVDLGGAGFRDIVVDASGTLVTAVRSDVGEDSGVYTLHLDCETGALMPVADHYSLRLSAAIAPLPNDPTRAVLLGGQAAFEPFDEDDIRLLSLEDDHWVEVAKFDIYGDFVDAEGIAVSDDGLFSIIPNGSPFSDEGGQIVVVSIDGDVVTEETRLTDLGDVRQARFAADGHTALVTNLEGASVHVLANQGGGYAITKTINGIGVADEMAVIRRGPSRGTVLVPSTSPADGPQLVVLHADAGDAEITSRVQFGEGFIRIVKSIAVAP